jgi:uncharacterized protein (DUF1501 family)
MKKEISRRNFIQIGAGALASTSVLGFNGVERAFAAAPAGYKALVCLFMNGGNNGHNWVVPLTPAAHSIYAAGRTNLALAPSSLLPLRGTASNGVQYGLHSSCPELQALYNSGKAAIIGNVGPLIHPTTAAQAIAGSIALPPQLFSHHDQANEWMTGVPQSPERFGWGGKVADLFSSQGMTANLAFNIDIGGANYWSQGAVNNPYTLGTGGAPSLSAAGNGFYRNGLRQQATEALLNQSASDPNILVSSAAGIFKNAASKVSLVQNALAAAGDLTTQFPAAAGGDWGLSQQLHEVARVIKAQAHIGDSRQMFFVQLGGFDTHNGELATQQTLLTFVSKYVNVFYQSMVEVNMQNNVTLFTVSDFGRTLQSNGDGADHGWGNHQMVVGGAVKGGEIYGTMPDLTLRGPNDFGQGRLVPTTSADQHAATLASWFGVADSSLNSIFTNLPNFNVRNLGFMG